MAQGCVKQPPRDPHSGVRSFTRNRFRAAADTDP